MAGRACDHEEVPDEVVVTYSVCGKKRETAGVSNSTGEYQQNSGHWYERQYWFGRYYRQPTHQNVEYDRDAGMACALYDF